MTPPSLSPTGEPAAPEHIGLALRAVAFGALLGAGLVTLALWGARTLQLGAPATPPGTGPVFNLVVGGTLAGLGLAVVAAWALMRPLTSAYRRGGFAIIAGMACFLAILPTALIDRLAGRWGLLGFAGVCVLACLALGRKVAAGSRASA